MLPPHLFSLFPVAPPPPSSAPAVLGPAEAEAECEVAAVWDAGVVFVLFAFCGEDADAHAHGDAAYERGDVAGEEDDEDDDEEEEDEDFEAAAVGLFFDTYMDLGSKGLKAGW